LDIYTNIERAQKANKTLIAQLLDPDHIRNFDHLVDCNSRAEECGVDLFFFGGSLVTLPHQWDPVKALKEISSIPVILFPSSPAHININADGLLFLSLISGRNPEFLIGSHVQAAPILRNSSVEILPTGYILVSCGSTTTAEYMSNSSPIPYEKPEIAGATALAGQMLGMKMIYLDGGSGAEKTISPAMIRTVKSWINIPLIVGGGIKTLDDAEALSDAGADVLVVGNGAEKKPEFISDLCQKMK